MKPGQTDSHRELALFYLGSAETDSFVVEKLRRIDGIEAMLIDVVEGRIEASPSQARAAIYVLGYLRVPAAIPTLLRIASGDRTSRRFVALAALGAVGPDRKAKDALKKITGDKDTDPIAVAFAIGALGRMEDPEIAAFFKEHPPAHADDPAVKEMLARCASGRRDSPVPPKAAGETA